MLLLHVPLRRMIEVSAHSAVGLKVPVHPLGVGDGEAENEAAQQWLQVLRLPLSRGEVQTKVLARELVDVVVQQVCVIEAPEPKCSWV